MTGSDNSSQLHQSSSNVSGSRQSASKFRLGGITDAPPSGPFKMPKSPAIAPLYPPGHVPLSSLLSKISSSTYQTTMVDTGGPQTDTARTSDGATSAMFSGAQSDISYVGLPKKMSQVTATLTAMTIPVTMIPTTNMVLLVFLV